MKILNCIVFYITVFASVASAQVTVNTGSLRSILLSPPDSVAYTNRVNEFTTVQTVDSTIVVSKTTSDDVGGVIQFLKDSATPADDDVLGEINFDGDDSGGGSSSFVRLRGIASDVTATDEGGKFTVETWMNNIPKELLTINGYNGTVGEGIIELNKAAEDVDFVVYNDAGDSASVFQGSTGFWGLGGSPPSSTPFYLTTSLAIPVVNFTNTNANALGTTFLFYKNSASPADNDIVGTFSFLGNNSSLSSFTAAAIQVVDEDVTDTDEAGSMTLFAHIDSDDGEFLKLSGYQGTVGKGIAAFNTEARNISFAYINDAGDTTVSARASEDDLRVKGWVYSRDFTPWDIIAWFPPADSGAVLDTLDNRKEVLGFYHNTDSVYATSSWSVPPKFTGVDSVVVDVESPNNLDDGGSFVLKWVGIAEGELGSAALANTLRDTVALGSTTRAVVRVVFSGFSGISAEDEVMFELSRDNTISGNAANVINVRRTRIYWQ